MKENTGLSARKRRQRCVCQAFTGFCVLYGFGIALYQNRFSGSFIPDVEIDSQTGKKRHRRRPEWHHQQFHPDQPTEPQDAVLEGYLTLVDVQIMPSSLQATDYVAIESNNKYKDVYGMFCAIDWNLQQQNPSTVAMFRDLRAKSKMCEGTLLRLNLYDIARQAEEYDHAMLQLLLDDKDNGIGRAMESISDTDTSSSQSSTAAFKPHLVQSVLPTGVVFHETRCGSTLTANLLARSDPLVTRVYSESPPPLAALKACGEGCNTNLHQQLIHDVFYMMGRRRIDELQQDKRHYTFYKFQSITVHHIEKFANVFPDTPWVFIYRNSVEVMQSHLKTTGGAGSKANAWSGSHLPVCARYYGAKVQPTVTKDLVMRKGKSIKDLTIPQYCAAHLAGLSQSALREHGRSRTIQEDAEEVEDADLQAKQLKNANIGRVVNYNQLPDIIWESILPDHFHVPVSMDSIELMKETAGVYSKGRGKKANEEWQEDSTNKRVTASAEVLSASRLFLDDTYRRLEELSQESTHR